MTSGHFEHVHVYYRRSTGTRVREVIRTKGFSNVPDPKAPEGFVLLSHSTEYKAGVMPKKDDDFWDWSSL